MTCIVGITDNGKVYLGGDSAGVSSHDVIIRRDSKVFVNGPFVMGFTSSFRMGQLLKYGFSSVLSTVPEPETSEEIERFMCTTFIDEVRKCLKDGGWLTKDKEQEEGGDFLVGYKGRLFQICSDFQVGESINGYDSVGCGSSYALGSLFTTEPRSLSLIDMEPKRRLKLALETAEYFSTGVRGPFNFVEG